ncbi:MAG: SDR family NAD(P)-dependent oxidoreductase [Pseudomonadota bacterium]
MSTWLQRGKTAVITGGASGIGLECARRYLEAGMNVVLADRSDDALSAAPDSLGITAIDRQRLLAVSCDVTKKSEVEALCERVYDRFGAVHCLMNNAGRGFPAGAPWENADALEQTLAVNLWGVIHGCQVFIPRMLSGGEAGVVVNTGSKQGITRPPGNFAYNLSKVGVLAYTESVAHAFREREGCLLTAHLLVPGFVYTPMVSRFIPEKPAFAWTAEQTVEFMLPRIEAGDFYIICPDEESPRELDELRIQWGADDLIHNRPALSRWHPDYAEDYEAFIADRDS